MYIFFLPIKQTNLMNSSFAGSTYHNVLLPHLTLLTDLKCLCKTWRHKVELDGCVLLAKLSLSELALIWALKPFQLQSSAALVYQEENDVGRYIRLSLPFAKSGMEQSLQSVCCMLTRLHHTKQQYHLLCWVCDVLNRLNDSSGCGKAGLCVCVFMCCVLAAGNLIQSMLLLN